jgi:hypothetical protein
MDYGIKVTQPGYDVSTATIDQTIVTSKYPNIQTYQVGTTSHTLGSTGEYFFIYYPGITYFSPVLVFAKNPNDSYWRYLPWIVDQSSGYLRYWYADSGGGTIWIVYGQIAGNPYNPVGETWQFKYYVTTNKIS